jgi:hypothetical protein
LIVEPSLAVAPKVTVPVPHLPAGVESVTIGLKTVKETGLEVAVNPLSEQVTTQL